MLFESTLLYFCLMFNVSVFFLFKSILFLNLYFIQGCFTESLYVRKALITLTQLRTLTPGICPATTALVTKQLAQGQLIGGNEGGACAVFPSFTCFFFFNLSAP